jgi:hypothetical protein
MFSSCRAVRKSLRKPSWQGQLFQATRRSPGIAGKDLTFAWGDGKVRLNGKYTSVDNIKIGDKGLFILEKSGDTTTLKAVMLKRK